MISKSLSTSEKFASLTDVAGELAEFCQVLYPLIVSHADDFGRLQGDAFTVKHMCFPTSPRSRDQFADGLSYLQDVVLIQWYQLEDKKYLQVLNFEAHQQGLHKRTESIFPECPGTSGKFLVARARGTELNLREGKGTEGKGTQENSDTNISSGRSARAVTTSNGKNGAQYRTDPIIGRNTHLTHAACDETFSYCVPSAVHHKLADLLAPKHGGDREAAKAALQVWYSTVWRDIPKGTIMGDAFKFWQSHFDGAFASKPKKLSQLDVAVKSILSKAAK